MRRVVAVFIFIFLVFIQLSGVSIMAQQLSYPAESRGTRVEGVVGQFYLNLYGFISPFASVILSSDGNYIAGTTADSQGNFSFAGILINKGFSNFCLDAVDFKRVGESYTCFNIPPATDSVTMRDIFLPPTLGLSRTTVNEGGSAVAFGYTMPGATVTLHINDKTITVVADSSGYYEIKLDNLKAGVYNLYSTANYQQKESLTPSKKLQLEALSKPQQAQNVVRKVGEELAKVLKNWLWNPLWLIIPIIILIIILIRKLWGHKFAKPFKKKNHLLHHYWMFGY